MNTAVANDAEVLKMLGLDGQFKTLADLKKFTTDAQSAIKERDSYKTRFSSLGKAASGAGYKDVDEVFRVAAEARKKAAPGNFNGSDWRKKIEEHYKGTYGEAEFQKMMGEDSRLPDFWAKMLQDVISSIPTDKFLTQDKLDEFNEMMADQFSERDFFGGLEGDERKLARQFAKDIRRIYADEKLYDAPDGADDTYNGFAEAWKRHKAGLEKAGMKMTQDRRQPVDEPTRRIAFPANAIASSAADDKFRPGPGFDEKAFLRENPELQDQNGDFDWAKGFALGKE